MKNPKLDSKFVPLILPILVLLMIPNCTSQNDEQYQTCRQPFQCGNLGGIGYPFSGGNRPPYCSYPGFELDCQGDDAPLLNIPPLSYRVLAINNTAQTLRVSRQDLWNTTCPRFIFNTVLNFSLFDFSSIDNDQSITLYYGCSVNQEPTPAPNQFNCSVNGTDSWSFYVTGEATGPGNGVTCNSNIFVSVNQTAAQALANFTTTSIDLLQEYLASGFWIRWSAENDNCNVCVRSGGACGYNQGAAAFACYCSDGPHEFDCNDTRPAGNGNSSNLGRNIGLSVGGAVLAGVGLGCLIFYCRRQIRQHLQYQGSNQNVDKFLINNGSLAPKRYSYEEIKKITKSFSDKLGQGGYGIVYKGKLPDGQLVAVKVLTDTSDNAEEFISEVASISRTSHVNIVNLLGYSYDRKGRTLVYEYMPNKSLDAFIYKSGSDGPNSLLDWETLYEIAVGVGRGLEYLHIGCNTRIVHFDIKPQNILLDEDLCPKISDFGLAKLFKKKQSKISMLGMRGTFGYIAPEVFSRNFGVVSDKSDVYSYGMMLLEMAGARKVDEIEATQSIENYFLDKIYEHIILKNKKLDDIMREEEEETARKMILVGLWCIQTAPSDRPSMTKVVEKLEGSLQYIQIPPKPFLSTPMLSRPQFSSSFSVNVETENSSES